MEMNRLVVNGVAYTVADPDAAHVADGKVSREQVWSSQGLVDKLCPGFSESGGTVTCQPVEGYPLGVVSKIALIQEGSGDPRPARSAVVTDANIRQINDDPSTGNFRCDTLAAGKTYRLTVNATDHDGEPVRLTQECVVVQEDEAGSYAQNIAIRDNYIDFTIDQDVGVQMALFYENGVDADSMYDFNASTGDGPDTYTLKDGALVLQEYDPGNVRPISGHSAVKLWRGGKNLLSVNNVEVTHYSRIYLASPIPAGTYVFSCGNATSTDTDTTRVLIHFYGLNKSVGHALFDRGVAFEKEITFTEPVVALYVYAGADHGSSAGDTATFTNMMISAEGGEFEPYRGETVTVDLGQTVYGGSYDWQTGVLTIDKKQITLDGTETWETTTTGTAGVPRYRLPKYSNQDLLANIKLTAINAIASDKLMCSVLPTISADAGWMCKADGIYAEAATVINVVHRQYATDVDALKEMMKGAQIVFGLETPITVQLTSRELLALSGVNTLSGDTGDIRVTGRADPTAILEKLTNAIVALGGSV